jgi:cobalt-zinc-cadmium resistance protein CzcA
VLERILRFSLRARWAVIAATAVVAVLGAFQLARLPIDAVPDITNVQVQINTEARGMTPLEVEQRITFPIEAALGGLPRLAYTRSLSRYGLSQVTVVFEDGTDIYFARQLLNERLQEVRSKLPPRRCRSSARSRRGSARSSCSSWRPSRARRSRRPICARSRTGS